MGSVRCSGRRCRLGPPLRTVSPRGSGSAMGNSLRSACLWASFVVLSPWPGMVSGEDLGLRVAPGFRVTLFADEKLANDIYCMTLDPQGRVVVSGQGYVKVLHDNDGDGRADAATTLA